MKVFICLFFVYIGSSIASKECFLPTFLPAKCDLGAPSTIIAGDDGLNGNPGSPGFTGSRGPPGNEAASCKLGHCAITSWNIYTGVMHILTVVRKIDIQLDLVYGFDFDHLTREELLKLVTTQKHTLFHNFVTIEDLDDKVEELKKKLRETPTGRENVDDRQKLVEENKHKSKMIKNLMDEIEKLHKKLKDCKEKDDKIVNLKKKVAELEQMLKESGHSVKALKDLHKKINILKDELTEKAQKLNDEIKKLKEQLKNKSAENDKLQSKMKEMHTKLEEQLKASKLLEKTNEDLKKKLEVCDAKFKTADKHQKDIIKNLQDKVSSLGSKTAGVSLLEKKVEELNEKLKTLTDLQENLVFNSLNQNLAMVVIPKIERSLFSHYINGGRITLPGQMGSDGSGPYFVMVRRQSGEVDFNRNLKDYQSGFGNTKGDMWIGLDILHTLTCGAGYELRVELTDFNDKLYYAHYKTFRVNKGYDYELHTTGFSGNVDDALNHSEGMRFSTQDNDQDKSKTSECAKRSGGWWYKSCNYGGLTGPYHKLPTSIPHGIEWFAKGVHNRHYSWKKAVMLFKPRKCSWRPKTTVSSSLMCG